MVQSIAAKEVTLAQLRETFGLKVVRDSNFFTEWMQPLATLTSEEQQMLDRVKQNFESLMEDPPMLENTVKMVVLFPLLANGNRWRYDRARPHRCARPPAAPLAPRDRIQTQRLFRHPWPASSFVLYAS
jgi:hypothetical protein